MNIIITSEGDIMEAGMAIASEEGLAAVNIRSVARRAGISVGSVYNYFPNKSVLLSATVRKIWADIFYRVGRLGNFNSIAEYIQWFFHLIKEQGEKYGDFFLSQGKGFAAGGREISRETVEHCVTHMSRSLDRIIKKDQKVKPDVFDDTFSKEDLTKFIFINLLTMIARGETDCSVLIRVIERIVY